MARKLILIPLALLLLGACTAEIREADLLRPVAGSALAAEAVAQAAPAYSASQERIPVADGVSLYGVHLRQPGARATVLYFGGNGYTIGRFGAATAAVFAPLGVDLFLVDHRGYGQSGGRPSVEALGTDGVAVFDYLAAKLGPRARIVVHGQSLGSFIAGDVAARRAAAGVVLESSATTTEDWVRTAMPGAARAVLKVRIDESLKGRGNLANMARIEEPVLLLVGAKDRTTPPALSQALYAASPLPASRKTLVVVPDAGHVDALARPQSLAAYRRFLAALGS